MAQRGPIFGAKYFEDPSIAEVSALEYERLWERIGFKAKHGEWFYTARVKVLAEEMPDIAKAYGPEVAQRVQWAIQHTDPAQLAPDVRAAQKERDGRHSTAYLMETYGRVSWINRLFIKWTGTHFCGQRANPKRRPKGPISYNEDLPPELRPVAPPGKEVHRIYRHSDLTRSGMFQYYYVDDEGIWTFVREPADAKVRWPQLPR